MGQRSEHTEIQRRQCTLAETARSMGFANVTLAIAGNDLGRMEARGLDFAQMSA